MSEEEINELIEYNLDYSIEEDLEETKKWLKEANKEVERLNNIINKAIDYMDRRDLDWGSDEHNKMMNILKGSDKE